MLFRSGLTGVQMTQAAADVCTLAVSVPLTISVLKEMAVKGQQEKAMEVSREKE